MAGRRHALLHRLLPLLRHPVGVRAQALDRPAALGVRAAGGPLRLAAGRGGQHRRARPQHLPHPLRVGPLRFRARKPHGADHPLRRDPEPTDAPAEERARHPHAADGGADEGAGPLLPVAAAPDRLDGERLQQHPGHPARHQPPAQPADRLLRHAHTPLLQDTEIAPGGGLHHPRRVARIRHGRRTPHETPRRV